MIYVFLADGFEEVEAVTPIDYLRRAGIDVVTVGVTGNVVTGANGIPFTADVVINDAVCNDELDGIILPGGMPGTLNLEKSAGVQKFIDFCASSNRLIAAICAAPMILGHKGLLNGLEATCYPGHEKDCEGAVMLDKAVCCSKNYITARSAGVATQFATRIIEYLVGANRASAVLDAVIWQK